MAVSGEPEGAVDERKAVEAPSAGAGEMGEEAVGRCARAEEELLRGCSAAKTGDRRGGGAGCTRRRCGRAAIGKQCAAVVVADNGADKGAPKGGDAERGGQEDSTKGAWHAGAWDAEEAQNVYGSQRQRGGDVEAEWYGRSGGHGRSCGEYPNPRP
jgi:hypothetical protein